MIVRIYRWGVSAWTRAGRCLQAPSDSELNVSWSLVFSGEELLFQFSFSELLITVKLHIKNKWFPDYNSCHLVDLDMLLNTVNELCSNDSLHPLTYWQFIYFFLLWNHKQCLFLIQLKSVVAPEGRCFTACYCVNPLTTRDSVCTPPLGSRVPLVIHHHLPASAHLQCPSCSSLSIKSSKQLLMQWFLSLTTVIVKRLFPGENVKHIFCDLVLTWTQHVPSSCLDHVKFHMRIASPESPGLQKMGILGLFATVSGNDCEQPEMILFSRVCCRQPWLDRLKQTWPW